MAKDREKLFKGTDDKAITFQRAVFIVCNLKRLIKRPKKDDKHGTSSGGSRKRSGADCNDDDERSGTSAGYSGRKSRFKDPVRRAFTLPTMLCNSFSPPGDISQSSETGQQAAVVAAAAEALAQAHGQLQLQHIRQRLSASGLSAAGFQQPRATTGGHSFASGAQVDDHCEPTLGQRAHSGNLAIGGSTFSSDYYHYHGANTTNAAAAAAAAAADDDNNNDSSGNDYDKLNDNAFKHLGQKSSLSCLATPVRRLAAPAKTTTTTTTNSNYGATTSNEQRNSLSITLSQQQEALLAELDSRPVAHSTAAAGSRRPASGSRRPTKQHGYDEQASEQVCCPLWAYAMAQLDARQGQPRDQTLYEHLIGAPSALGYLLAPTSQHPENREGPAPEFGAPNSMDEQHEQLPQVLVSSGNFGESQHSATATTTTAPAQVKQQTTASTSLEEELALSRAQVQQPLASVASTVGGAQQRRSSDESMEKPRNSMATTMRADQDQQRELQVATGGSTIRIRDNRIQADSSAHNNNNNNNGNQSMSPNFELGSATCQQNQLFCLDQMRMKRFSSALCLVDRQQQQQQQQRQQVGTSEKRLARQLDNSPARASKGDVQRFGTEQFGLAAQTASISSSASQQQRKKSQAAKQQHQMASGRATKYSLANAGGLLAPDDPMILARRRRPSVSNQGSVNVDQQALFSAVECNQLERAKTILEDGKVNVNSLNGDKLTCLDIAVLMRNVEMAHLLQQYNAKESSAYLTREGRANQLYSLYTEAKRLVEDLSRSLHAIAPAHAPSAQSQQNPSEFASSPANAAQNSQFAHQNSSGPLMLATGSLLSNALLEEKQRQLQYWKRRLDLFMHMRYEFERLQVPSPPELIVLQVVGESSLGVKIVHSLRSNCNNVASAVQQQLFGPCEQQQQQAASSGDPDMAQFSPESAQQQLQQHQQCAQVAALRCTQGPKCSHWSLSEFREAQANLLLQQQEHERYCQLEERNLSSPLTSYQHINYHQEFDWHNDRPASEQQIKQQKLAVFNQLLAQQLAILSYQQQKQHQQVLQSGTVKFVLGGDSTSARSSVRNGDERARGSLVSNDSNSSTKQQQQQPVHSQRPPSLMLIQNNSTDGAICNMVVGAGSRQAFGLGAADSAIVGYNCRSTANSNLEQWPSLAYRLMIASAQNQHERIGAMRPLLQSRELAGARERAAEDKIIITKYKVEWSLNESMEPILNSMIVYYTNYYPLECQISGLTNGFQYYVRVSSGNHGGFSKTRPSAPISLSPSSWRQVDGNKRRKYDEEVFRKFTKLILLNKHILDDHQLSGQQVQQIQSQQQQQLLAKLLGPATISSSTAIIGSAQQNKSSLINMLLLDATTPTGEQLKEEYRVAAECQFNQQLQQDNSSQQQPQSLSVRKNLRNFFQSNSFKFHKLSNQNKRGLYLTTVIYHSPNSHPQQQQLLGGQHNKSKQQLPLVSFGQSSGDKIVVTNDDRLPIIEVLNDLVSPAALMSDFYWLLKINGTQWMDIKRLRQQLQKSHSSSTLHLRIKLLSAIEQMQVALNMEDIGRLYYKPIHAHHGSIIICTCKFVANTKLVSNLSIKWTQQHKIIPRHLRKISDSMLTTNGAQQQQQQQQQQPQKNLGARKSRQERDSIMTISSQHSDHLPATTISSSSVAFGPSSSSGISISSSVAHADHLLTVSGESGLSSTNSHQQSSNSSATLTTPTTTTTTTTTTSTTTITTANTSVAVATATAAAQPQSQGVSGWDLQALATASGSSSGGGGGAIEFRLCEHCQYSLIQRRCTMASGSSSSSLTSSNDSQWSNSCNSSAPAARCTCNNSGNSNSNASQPASQTAQQQQSGATANCPAAASAACGQLSGGGANLLSASNSQRGSTATVTSRSGSVISSTPTHHASISSAGARQSQAFGQQQFSGAQKSSTYLMLASLSLYDLLLFSLNEIIEFDRVSTVPLSRGLYLGFVQLQTTVESMRLLVPRSRPNMVPCARVRDNAHVSREEWQLLKRFASLSWPTGSTPTQQQQSPVASVAPLASDDGVDTTTVASAARVSDLSIWSGGSSSGGQQQQTTGQLASIAGGVGAMVAAAATIATKRAPTGRAQTGQQNHQSARLPAYGSPGFDRGRAKSVSPGLSQAVNSARAITTTTTTNVAVAAVGYRDCLSISQLQQTLSHRSTSMPPDCTESTSNANASSSSSSVTSAAVTEPPAAAEISGDERTSEPVTHGDTDLTLKSSRENSRCTGETFVGCVGGSQPQPLMVKDSPPTAAASSGGGGRWLIAEAASESSLLATNTTTAEQNAKHQQAPGSAFVGTQQQPLQKTKSRSPTGSSGRLTVNNVCNTLAQSPEETFVRLVGSAARRLLAGLKSQLPKVYDEQTDDMVSILQSLNDDENNRIYHVEIIELSSQVTFILLIPSAENVCPVTSQEKSNILGDNRDYMLLPLQIFETIHISTYEPDLLGKYSRLSAILETDLIVAQHDHRQAFSSNELKSTKSRVSHLQDMVSIADDFWRQLRWIVDVVSFARDKSAESAKGGIRLGSIWRHFELSPSVSYEHSVSSGGQHTALVGTGGQVKRTSSARSRDDQPIAAAQQQQPETSSDERSSCPSSGGVPVDSGAVPEIHLTQSVGTASRPTDQQQQRSNRQQQQQAVRRHSGAEQKAKLGAGGAGGRAHTGAPIANTNNNSDKNNNARAGDREPSAFSSSSKDTNPSLSYYCRQHVGRALDDCRVQCTVLGPDIGQSCPLHHRASESRSSVENNNNNYGDNGACQCCQASRRGINKSNNRNTRGSLDDCFHDDNLLNFKLPADGSEDEEATIYAYHISLRDATKAAAQRKSSQHSTRPFLEGYEPTSPVSGAGNGASAFLAGLSNHPQHHLKPTLQSQPNSGVQSKPTDSNLPASNSASKLQSTHKTTPSQVRLRQEQIRSLNQGDFAAEEGNHNPGLSEGVGSGNGSGSGSGSVSSSSSGVDAWPARRGDPSPEGLVGKLSRSIGATAMVVPRQNLTLTLRKEEKDEIAGRVVDKLSSESESTHQVVTASGGSGAFKAASSGTGNNNGGASTKSSGSDILASRQTTTTTLTTATPIGSKPGRFKHLKATNPFLSDSFDFYQADE